MKKTIYLFKTFFFPERCPYCNKVVEPEEYACENCRKMLRDKHQAIKSGARGYRCVSSFIYDGRVRRILLRIKFHERTQFLPQLAVILAQDIRNTYPDIAFDCITAVPMHKRDLHKRGFNQSEILARSLGELLELPYLETLTKIKRTKQQHRLKFAERKKNLNGAFAVIDKELVRGKRILVIDDIITSGCTLGNCCKTLNKAKPELLCCATIASARNDYPNESII